MKISRVPLVCDDKQQKHKGTEGAGLPAIIRMSPERASDLLDGAIWVLRYLWNPKFTSTCNTYEKNQLMRN